MGGDSANDSNGDATARVPRARTAGWRRALLVGAPTGMLVWQFLPWGRALVGAVGMLLVIRLLVVLVAGELRE